MTSRRVKKVGSLIKTEISEIIQKGIPCPASCIMTITEATPTADLKNAKVFISIYGDDEEGTRYFNRLVDSRKFIRKELYGRVHLRYVPELEFIRDNSIAEGDKVLKIFQVIDQEKNETDKENI